MRSLAYCLDKIGNQLSKTEKDAVRAAAQAYRAEGFEAHKANVWAVEQILADLEAEKADILAQIEKQDPELAANLKEADHAGGIREDEKGVSGSGVVPEGGKEEGREDLEQQAPEGSGVSGKGEEKQPKGKKLKKDRELWERKETGKLIYTFKKEFEDANRKIIEKLSYTGELLERESLDKNWVQLVYAKVSQPEESKKPVEIRAKSGMPYKNRSTAIGQLRRKKLTKTHEVKAVAHGFVLAPRGQTAEDGGQKTEKAPKEKTVRVPQSIDDLDSLYSDAEESLEEFNAFTQGLADKYKGKAVFRRFFQDSETKTRESAQKKLKGRYKGDGSKLTDILASTVIFDSMDGMEKALAACYKDDKVVTVVNSFVEKRVDGYRDAKLLVAMKNGHVAEVQLHFQPFHEAKEVCAHKIFEVIRDLNDLVEKGETEEIRDEARKYRDKLNEKSRGFYDAIFSQPKTLHARVSETSEEVVLILDEISESSILCDIVPLSATIKSSSVALSKANISKSFKRYANLPFMSESPPSTQNITPEKGEVKSKGQGVAAMTGGKARGQKTKDRVRNVTEEIAAMGEDDMDALINEVVEEETGKQTAEGGGQKTEGKKQEKPEPGEKEAITEDFSSKEIRAKNGKPYKNKGIAVAQLRNKKLTKTHEVKAVTGGFVLAPKEVVKTEEKTQGVQAVTGKKKTATQPKKEPTATDLAKQFAKEGVTGIDEALTGLTKLFGGAAKFGPAFDEDTYNQAKPHFQAALDATVAAGKTAKDFVRILVKQFGAVIAPYVKRFMQEVKSSTQTADKAGTLTETEKDLKLKEKEPATKTAGKGGEHGRTESERTGEPESGESLPGEPGGGSVFPGARPVASGERTGEHKGAVRAGSKGPEGEGLTGGTTSEPAGGPVREAGGEPVRGTGEGHGSSGPGGRAGVSGGSAGEVAGGPGTVDTGLGGETEAGLAEEDRNHVIEPNDVVFPRGDETKIQANIKAIRLLRQLQSENRNPTTEEKKVLAQYVGWGAFAQKVFNRKYNSYLKKHFPEIQPDEHFHYNDLEKYKAWVKKYGKKLHHHLGGLMTEEEWDAATESTLNAHYTSTDVIIAMWKMAERLGFKGGRVLEPAGGIGHFFGLMPQDMAARSELMGVEKDTISGAIFKKLYPEANIQVTGFENAQGMADNSMDLVISNFPFGKYPVFDKAHPDYSSWSIHNYFFARTMDAVKPGGLVMSITSHYTLDAKTGGAVREYFQKKADLIGAVRLPHTAFKKDAGTDVCTDILIFRKKDGKQGLGQDFRTLNEVPVEKDQTALVNEYFEKHPDMVLGKHSLKGSMHGSEEYTVLPNKKGEIEDLLSKALEALPENIMGEAATQTLEADKLQWAKKGEKEGSLVFKDDEFHVVEQGIYKTPTMINSKGEEVPALDQPKRREKAEAYLKLRDQTKHAIARMQEEDATDSEVESLIKDLNATYDDFVGKYGNIGKPQNSFLYKIDNEFPMVDALETVKVTIEKQQIKSGKNKGKWHEVKVKHFKKSAILGKRCLFPFVEPETAENLEDALKISQIYRGTIDAEYMGQLVGQPVSKVRAELLEGKKAFLNPETGLLEAPDEYLSGNVRKKWEIAKAQAEQDPLYEKNAEALKAVQPEPLDIDFIYYKLGTTWIPNECVQDFLKDTMGVTATVRQARTSEHATWTVDVTEGEAGTKNTADWGTERRRGDKLVLDGLNLKNPVIIDRWTDPDGTKHSAKNVDDTTEAQLKLKEIQLEFTSWSKGHDTWADKLADIFNEEYRGQALREFPIPDIDYYPGASKDFDLRETSKRAVSRCLQESTLLSYGVGTGKTFIYTTLAMEMRRLKTARKPLIVAHNVTLQQYADAFKMVYPQAKVLIPNDQQRSAKFRKKTLMQIATGDWDAVVLPHSFFDGIADDPQREASFVRERLAELEEIIDEADDQDPTTKQMETTKKIKEEKLQRLLNRRKDDVLTFEQLGVDALLIDEAHRYKRSEFFTKMGTVKGIDQGASQRSTGLMLKSGWVRQKTSGKNVVLATGTPISNTTAELWTLLRYVRPEILEEYGVPQFDDFASRFGDTSTTTEETPTGEYKRVERFNKYVNGPTLLTMFHSVSDVLITKKANLKLPDIKGGKAEIVEIERPPELERYILALRERYHEWENMTGKEKMANRHVPLVIYGLAKKSAIDMRLVDPSFNDNPKSKLNTVVKNVYDIWKETAADKSTQTIFLDSFRDSSHTFNAYEDIKTKLIAKGIPADEIVDIGKFKETARESQIQRIRDGKARVVIGSTEKLGTGVNMQDRLVAAHHVDVPNRPMDIEQREGRIIREKNRNKEVRILVYGVKNTLDSVLFNRLVKKQKFIDQVLMGEIEGYQFDEPNSEEQISFAEMNAAFSGNPLLFDKLDWEVKVKELRILKEGYKRKISKAKRNVRWFKEKLEDHEKALVQETGTARALKEIFPEGKADTYTFKGETYTRKDFVKALDKEWKAAEDEAKKLFHGKKLGECRKLEADGKGRWHHKITVNGAEPVVLDLHMEAKEEQVLAWQTQVAEEAKGDDRIIRIDGVRVDFELAHGKVTLGRNYPSAPAGLPTMVNNIIQREIERPDRTKADIDKLMDDIRDNEKVEAQPFKDEDALRAAEVKLGDIETELQSMVGEVAGGETPTEDAQALDRSIETAAGSMEGVEEEQTTEDRGQTTEKEEKAPAYPNMQAKFGDNYHEEINAKPTVTEFMAEGVSVFKTQSGNTTNGMWLLKPDFVNSILEKRIATIGGLQDRQVDDSVLWPSELPEPGTHEYSIDNEIRPVAVYKTGAGAFVGFNEYLVSYLHKNIKGFELRIKDAKGPAVIMSGDTRAGLLMPLREEHMEDFLENPPEGETRASVMPGQYPVNAQGPAVRYVTQKKLGELKKLATHVREWLNDVLPPDVMKRVDLELKPVISLTGKNIKQTLREHGEIPVDRIIGATTIDRMKALIELSYEYDKKKIHQATYHEAFHVVAAWLLPKKDYSQLIRHYKTEEAAADAFAAFAMKGKIKGFAVNPGIVRRIFRKLKRLLAIVRNGLNGKGFAKPQDVFARIWTQQYPYPHTAPARTAIAFPGTQQSLFQVAAWQGGPHEIGPEGYSNEWIGKGEGSQAFGWGHYFSDLKAIGEYYAKEMSHRNVLVINGTKLMPGDSMDAHIKALKGTEDMSVERVHEFLSEVEFNLRNDLWDNEIIREFELNGDDDFAKLLEKNDIELSRHLYKVTLHKDKKPGEYTWLEWDKPVPVKVITRLKDQSVKEELNKRGKFTILNSWVETFENAEKDKANVLRKDGNALYASLASSMGGKKEASLFLLRAGIDGIRYESGTLSGMKEPVAHNYVVFDPAAVTIEEHTRFSIDKTTGPELSKELEQNRTFANKIFRMGDMARHRIGVEVGRLQERVQKLAGTKSKRKLTLGFAYKPDLKRSMASDQLDRAMMIYRDLQAKPEKADEFRAWAETALKDPKTTGQRKIVIRKQVKLLDAALNLNPDQKAFVEDMAGLFEDAYGMAKTNKLVQSHRDHYVRRLWKLPEGKEDSFTGTGSGYGFKTFTTAAKERTLDTILDGWMAGYELQVEGITNSYQAYMSELSTIVANKAFISEGVGTKDINGNPLFSTDVLTGYAPLKASGFSVWKWKGMASAEVKLEDEDALVIDTYGRKFFATPPERVPEMWAVYSSETATRAKKLFEDEKEAQTWAEKKGFSRVEHREAKDVAQLFEKQPLYAPAPLADMINKMTATDSLFSKTPAAKAVLRLNASLKSYILLSSFFHHLAGTRSWIFGVHHGWKKANPIAAFKEGLRKIEDLHPLIDLGVKNGLTFGELQDWSETLLRDDKGLTEALVSKLGLEKASKAIEKGKFYRETFADSLFKKFFAGLKAEAFCVEYAHELQKAQDKYAAGKMEAPPNPDQIAEKTATLINADFGGLHTKRMGRNPTLQKLARLMLLAPDWTESNFRTVTGMVPGLNDWIGTMIGDVPGPRGMDKVYRKFWGRVALRIAVMTIIAQLLLNGKDESEEFVEEQMLSNRFSKFRWTEVDVTRLYNLLGVDTEGHRKTFSLGGHFFDPLKLIDPWRLIKGKGSPVTRLASAIGTGTDWAGRPFTGVTAMVGQRKTIKKSAYEKTEGAFNRLPATIVNQVINMQPIQIGHLIRYWQGEEDGLTAIMHSAGAATHTAWEPQLTTPIVEAKGVKDRAYDAVKGLSGVLRMGPPSRHMIVNGLNRKMTREQYEKYLSESSALARKKIEVFLAGARYKNMDQERRAKTIASIIRNARKKVRSKIKKLMAAGTRAKVA